MDNLKLISQKVNEDIDPNGAPESITAQNNNDIFQTMLSSLGKYTGFPYVAKTQFSGIIIPGQLFFNGAFNTDSHIYISRKTADGTDLNSIIEAYKTGDMFHVKDFQGKSVFFNIMSINSLLDTDSNEYYDLSVTPFSSNSNYSYQNSEENICIIEFILKSKKFIKSDENLSKAQRIDDTLYGIIDKYTGEQLTLSKTTDTNTADGIIYFDLGAEKFKRNYQKYVNVRWFGAKDDGVVYNDLAFLNCIDYAVLNSETIFVPKTNKFYLFEASKLMGDEATAMANVIHVAIEMKSNITIVSDKAVLKIKDNISSMSEPKHMRLFFSNDFLENISISGLILDMNGQNNLISPDLPTSSNNYTQAHILFSGTKEGIASGVNNLLVEHCEFLNTAGVTCIGLAQSNTADVELGSNIIIRFNRFYNNGLNSSDHSSIFAWANNVQCYNNVFDNPNPFNNLGGGLVTFEVHGSNQKYYNNVINNYYQGLWVSVNVSQRKIENVEIYGNTASVSCVFIDFYNANLELPPYYNIEIDGVQIRNNDVVITDDFVLDEVKQFVRIGSRKHPKNVTIENNTLKNLTTIKNTSFATIVMFSDQVSTLENLIIKNNNAIDIGDGVISFWGEEIDIESLEISNNTFKYKVLENSNNVDVYGYGTFLGKVLKMVVNGNATILTDNDGRFVIKGFNNLKPKISIGGVNIGDGYINYKCSNNGDILNIECYAVFGGATSFTGTPFIIRLKGATATQRSVGNAFLISNGINYKAYGLVDVTGEWLSLYTTPADIVNNVSPNDFGVGDSVIANFNIVHNGITF